MAGASLQMLGYVAFSFIAGVWAVALVGMWFFRPKVRIVAQHAERVCAGEILPVDVDIEQRGRVSLADLAVLPHRLPPEVDASPAEGVPLPPLKRGQRIRVRVGLSCPPARRVSPQGIPRGDRLSPGPPAGDARAGRGTAVDGLSPIHSSGPPATTDRASLSSGRRGAGIQPRRIL